MVEGLAEKGFEPCLAAFRENIQDGGELGAACTIYLRGSPVLDVWGGFSSTSPDRHWARDTAVPVFSVTKGVAALCILSLVSRGLIDLDQPVAHYWPEFGVNGKDRVSVREALGHRAGVPILSGSVTMQDLADPRAMASRLAQEVPVFEPGTDHIYHGVSVGWITSELVFRTTGVSIGAWLHAQLTEPMKLNLRIGRSRLVARDIATVEVPEANDTPEIDTASLPARAISLNGLIVPRMSGLAAALNDPGFQEIELAGANCVSDARSLAALYSEMLGYGGKKPWISPECIEDACQLVSAGPQFGVPLHGPSWGAGLMVPWTVQPMLGPGSFGHDGAGGVLAFAHAPSELTFAYVRNRAGPPGVADPMISRVLEALAACLGIHIPVY